MNEYARTAQGGNPAILSVERPFSFFQLVRTRFGGSTTLHRIFSQVRLLGGLTTVIEQLEKPDDLEDENADLKQYNTTFVGSSSCRISFFKTKFNTRSGLSIVKDEEFIGYVIFKTDSFGAAVEPRVYESVLRSPRHDNNFVRGSQSWNCTVMGRTFVVRGYLYAQQNGHTNVCAHVALRTAVARFHPRGDMSYREMNTLIGFNPALGTGMNVQQMIRVLESAGASCFVGDYQKAQRNAPPFQKYVYGSIESGYPAIIIFQTEQQCAHAIPVFGHTFNQDMWVPNAEGSYFSVGPNTKYIPSESWLSMFVCHDDNWGSNYCVPRHYLHPHRKGKTKGTTPVVSFVIGTMPKEVKVNPIEAEIIGSDYLFALLAQLPKMSGVWMNMVLEHAKYGRLVLRPYLLTSTEYATHLSRIQDWKRNRVDSTIITVLKNHQLFKEKVWMIELSVPELFSTNLRKVGEVLVRAEVPLTAKRDFGSFILARLPGYFAFFDTFKKARPKFSFIPSGIQGHVEMIGCEDP